MNHEPTATSFDLSVRVDAPLLRFVGLPEGLTVQAEDRQQFGSITVDFVAPSILRRVQQGRGGLLAKAVLPDPEKPMPLVWDVTAGLGRDAMTLAYLGCQVVAFERNPLVGMLLLDAHRRALATAGEVKEAAGRLKICIEDACNVLARPDAITQRPDVILLDPMFSEGKGKAGVKKEAMLLRMLVGEGADPVQDEELFTLSMQIATSRVVVKRSLRAPAIVESPPPQASFQGKSVRVDRYRSSS